MIKHICDRCGKDFTNEHGHLRGWPEYLKTAPEGAISIDVHRKTMRTDPDCSDEYYMPALDLCESCQKKLDAIVNDAMNYSKKTQTVDTDNKSKPVTIVKDPVNEMKKLIEQYFGVKFS